jgi:hypothetical protein
MLPFQGIFRILISRQAMFFQAIVIVKRHAEDYDFADNVKRRSLKPSLNFISEGTPTYIQASNDSIAFLTCC